MSAAQGHSYHLVDPSPWPIIGAFGAFLIAFGLLLFMHPEALGIGLQPALESIGL